MSQRGFLFEELLFISVGCALCLCTYLVISKLIWLKVFPCIQVWYGLSLPSIQDPWHNTNTTSWWYITIASTQLQKSEHKGLLPEQWIHLLTEVLDLGFTILPSDLVIPRKCRHRRQNTGCLCNILLKNWLLWIWLNSYAASNFAVFWLSQSITRISHLDGLFC